MLCKSCGAQIADTSVFCTNCGVRIQPVSGVERGTVTVPMEAPAPVEAGQESMPMQNMEQAVSAALTERVERTEATVPPENMGQTETAVPPENMGQAGTTVPTENMGQTEAAVSPENMGQTEAAVSPENIEKTEVTAPTENVVPDKTAESAEMKQESAAVNGQPQMGGVPNGQAPYGQPQMNGVPNGQAPYGQPQMGGVPNGQAPYGQPQMNGVSNGQAPYGQPQMGGVPNGQAPYGQPQMSGVPNGQVPYGQPQMNGVPNGQAPYGQPQMGGVPMGQAAFGQPAQPPKKPFVMPMAVNVAAGVLALVAVAVFVCALILGRSEDRKSDLAVSALLIPEQQRPVEHGDELNVDLGNVVYQLEIPETDGYRAAQALAESYIFADSDTVNLQESDFYELSDDDLWLAYYEILARAGVDLSEVDDDAHEYFQRKNWYEPTISLNGVLDDIDEEQAKHYTEMIENEEDPSYQILLDAGVLNETEIYNMKLIEEYITNGSTSAEGPEDALEDMLEE